MKIKVFSFVLGFLFTILSYGFYPQIAYSNSQYYNVFDPTIWDWYDCPSAEPTSSSNQPPSSDLPFSIPLALKLRFPLDLIYPINPMDLPIDDECLQTSLWGIQRDLCAPMQVAKVAKNIFLFSYILRSFMAL